MFEADIPEQDRAVLCGAFRMACAFLYATENPDDNLEPFEGSSGINSPL
jgi:hypothetical protein